MEFKGRVNLKELEKKSFEISSNQTDTWVLQALERAAPAEALTKLGAVEWASAALLDAELRVEKIGSDYMVSGKLNGRVQAPCSRCGDLFKAGREADFRIVLHRLERSDTVEEQDSGDADYVYFKGDDINLVEVLAEQMIVLEPVAEAPERKSDGSCTLCHLNPAFVEEGSNPVASSPFGKLMELKLGSKSSPES